LSNVSDTPKAVNQPFNVLYAINPLTGITHNYGSREESKHTNDGGMPTLSHPNHNSIFLFVISTPQRLYVVTEQVTQLLYCAAFALSCLQSLQGERVSELFSIVETPDQLPPQPGAKLYRIPLHEGGKTKPNQPLPRPAPKPHPTTLQKTGTKRPNAPPPRPAPKPHPNTLQLG
jgi:hypothetical protein